MTVNRQRPRGRPRDPEVQESILAAASALIAEGGIGAVTMEAVAERSGSSKPTLYRYWPNRESLSMAALMASAQPNTRVRATRSALSDLRRQLQKVASLFATPHGRNVVLMTASADPNTEIAKAFRNHVMLASREESRQLLLRAIQGEELRAELDLELALDMLYGPLFFRLLIGHKPVNDAFVIALVDQVFKSWVRMGHPMAARMK